MKLTLRRWLQFRLKTLLFGVVTICLLLGAWHLYAVYFGPYVAAGPAVVGEPFMVRGRWVDFLGFDSEVFVVQVSRPNAQGRPVIHQGASGRAARGGLWSYNFEVELAPIYQDGEYTIEARPLTKAVRDRKKHAPADSVWGRIVVKRAGATHE
jgi:hypothetical protein